MRSGIHYGDDGAQPAQSSMQPDQGRLMDSAGETAMVN
jgi:hypothetical protein